jgi:hypothetical protein
MAKFSAVTWSRRQALKLGVGVVAGTAAGCVLQTVSPEASDASADERNEVIADGVGRVEAIFTESVLAVIPDARILLARLIGFPTGVVPRVGDLVEVSTRPDGPVPLCAPTFPEPRHDRDVKPRAMVVVASPLSHWTRGIPMRQGNVVVVGGIRLVPTSTLLRAAHRGISVAVCTMDTTLADHQVLRVRSLE